MDVTTIDPDLSRTAVIALGVAIALTLLSTVALTAAGLIDPVAMLTWPTTGMPNAGGGSSAWYYETTTSDPLTVGLPF